MSRSDVDIQRRAMKDALTKQSQLVKESHVEDKKNYALKLLSNSTTRFVDKCLELRKTWEEVFDGTTTSDCIERPATVTWNCDALEGKISIPSSARDPMESIPLTIQNDLIKEFESSTSSNSREKEMYQYHISRCVRMVTMVAKIEKLKSGISSLSDTAMDVNVNTHITRILTAYVEKIHTSFQDMMKKFGDADSEAMKMEELQSEIGQHHQNVDRIYTNLVVITEALKILEPFTTFHTEKAGTLGVRPWYGSDEDYHSTKLYQVVKNNKWRRMDSESGLGVVQGERFRLNPMRTYLLKDPLIVAKDLSQAIDEARRYLRDLKKVCEGIKKPCKGGSNDGENVKFVFVPMEEFLRDVGSIPPRFPAVHKPLLFKDKMF